MNKKWGHRNSIVVPALFALFILLGGCGNSNQKTTSPAESPDLSTATVVGMRTCTGCHAVVTTDWMNSKHANAADGLSSIGSPTIGQMADATCKKCHDPLGDSAQLVAGYTGDGSTVRPVIGCESCHGPGSLHADSGGSGAISLLSGTYTATTIGSVPVSGQFMMCTGCHELLDSSGTGTSLTAAHLTTAPTGSPYVITDTHFATPGDWSGVGAANRQPATGWAMGPGNTTGFDDPRVCVNCHNPHKPATQNREWANSAHADKNFENLNSLGTGYLSGAWAHYNWSCDSSTLLSCGTSTTNPAGPHSDRRPCQRCHTTTGFVTYTDALLSGNTQSAYEINNGVYSLVTFTTGFKPEMLRCNGCHTDNKGTLRNPGQITANYDSPIPLAAGSLPTSRASHTYPDLAGSNVCMTCHVGRESGDTIKGLNDPALLAAGTIKKFNFGDASFINSHYLTAGGQIFTVTGYEFGGRPYDNISEYLHDKIGSKATQEKSPFADTGSNGPCIGCHMSRANQNGDHLFLPVSRSTTSIGEIVAVASVVCQKCHGASSTPILELIKIRKPQFKGALEALKSVIETNLQFHFFPYSPYWYRSSSYTDPKTACNQNIPVRNWQAGGTEKAPATIPGGYDPLNSGSCIYKGNGNGTAGTGQNNMGAAFNFNLLEHDSGAYAHNSRYTRRLIYDSIDWADDGILNYSVAATLNALGNTEAIEYLLVNQNGDATDRP